MRRSGLFVGVAFVLGAPFGAVAHAAEANPFFVESALPYHAPPFDKIADSDYQPAFERGMAEQKAEVDKIATNPAAPTFENTITALERSGRILDRVSLVFGGVYQANTNPALDKVEEAETPRLAAHQDMIFLNPRLFARVSTLYKKRDSLQLTAEQAQVLKIYYQLFVHAGAQLSETQKKQLRSINTRLATLETTFQQKLLAAAKDGALIVSARDQLAGLSDDELVVAARDAQDRKLAGKWVLPLQNTTQQPALSSLADRATREALFKASWTRAEHGDAHDTRDTIATIAQLRAQKAALLGYPNYAAYVLSDQMANTPDKVDGFVKQLVGPLAAEQKIEAVDVSAEIKKDGKTFELRPWDWMYYADRVRKARFDLDQAEVKPYFELHTVLTDGVFFAANQLYGLTFKKRTDIPVYNPDVMVFEVFDADQSPLGLMYFDYFKRDNKNGGAWMSNFVGQSALLGTKPVIYNVANFAKPADGQPALISFTDVTTMFHEFGHALHGLFAKQTYPLVSGTSVARDFVEFPSQFNEHWALDSKVLAHYAHDYKTGKPMPAALVEKIKRAAQFGQGYSLGEVVAAASLDMDWHELSAKAPKQDVDQFEASALAGMGLDTTDVPPRYRSSYFLHIWANDYAAGYYAYLWTQMLDDDAFSWFTNHGGLTRANGQRFRDMVLSQGHTQDYGPMFRAFYGQDPQIQPMLDYLGLKKSD